MFRFQIHDVHDVSLEFSRENLDLVHTMAFDFQLYYLTLADLHENLHLRGNDGLMSAEQFRGLFRDLGSSREEDAKLEAIFRGFDRTESGYCDITELTCGLSILCQGSKSSKLLFAFRLLDEDKDEYLTRRGIWRFIRSFLCVLLALSSSYNNMPSERFNALLDDLSVLISSEILANDAKRASFDMISSWYSTKGYLNSTWIELLDLKKWIQVPDGRGTAGDVPVEDTAETQSSDEDDEEEEEDYDSEEEEEDTAYYQASLTDGHSLVINANDTAHVLAVAAASGLSTMEPRELVDRLSQHAVQGFVSQRGFLSFLTDIPALDDLSPNIRNKVFTDLFAIFNTFEQYANLDGKSGTGRGAQFHGLAVGLTVLCMGSKSLKLEIGFRVMEGFNSSTSGEQAGRISQQALYQFLSAYLLVLTALGIIENQYVAIDTAMALCKVITEMLHGKITFPSFGKWYNMEGYNYAPWIELLNLDKWEKITGFKAESSAFYYVDEGEYVEDESSSDDDDEEDEDEASEDAFSIVLNSQSFERKVSVSKVCASKVFHFTRMFISEECNISQMVAELQAVSQDGLISKQDYVSVLQDTGFQTNLVLHGDQPFCLALFDAFDRANSGYCDIVELVTGVVMLDHEGTKSEKLVYAFDFIDTSRSGAISKREIWKFFRSFLISVVLLSCPDLRPSDYLHILVDESAVWVVESILSFVAKDSDVTPSHVSFDDIAEWYSAIGCSISAWIELLDFSKWIYLSS